MSVDYQIPAAAYMLRLYISGATPKSLVAVGNLKRLCEERLAGRYELEIIDLSQTPERARTDDIVALPTLVRKLPPPLKRVIGDLSNGDRVLLGLEVVDPSHGHSSRDRQPRP